MNPSILPFRLGHLLVKYTLILLGVDLELALLRDDDSHAHDCEQPDRSGRRRCSAIPVEARSSPRAMGEAHEMARSQVGSQR
jgi:hypothetical protein